ncbi:Imidazolonepropionase [Pustulibacterium marinum]|uniref:Imidazolonepropionase n=1 Tax=Pustulibacterium marinum TaxID=1224947 RepID=A0A1I7HH05_9FLAO|nr:amidohydrolase family protein [Pustulibacterium marinum]SFU60034.1 Imidazolonepropionase [Pustulibacterium marinum]
MNIRKFCQSGLIAIVFLALFACKNDKSNKKETLLLKDVTLIDGNGGAPRKHTDILIQGDSIANIGNNLDTVGVKTVNLSGKYGMPALISAHVHIGSLKGTTNKAESYTRDNILSQLKKYADYGVLNIMVMGSDRPYLFESGIRDSSAVGFLPGARIHSAGYGFGVPNGAPPINFAMDNVYRPTDIKQIPAEMDSLQKVNPEVVKIWVDDFGGKFTKMKPEIYKAIIEEAHKRQLRVAAHLYYLSDAKQLIADGVDIIGHSIRDSIIDDATIQQIKSKGIIYVPTLSLDEFTYIYARKPEWVKDPFFKNSLEPGVYEMITSAKYQNDLKNEPDYVKNVKAFEMALKNLKKLYDAGILVAMGTDSGAMPLRAQGFSEHLEMELMVQAGLTPLQAITVGTKNAAEMLKIDNKFGTIEKGKTADLLILNGNPAKNIKATRNIFSVYKAGKEVSNGPLK